MSAPMETDHANDGNDANPHVNVVNPLVNDGNPPLNERQHDGDGGNHALTNLQILCDDLALTVTEQKEELAAQERQFQGGDPVGVEDNAAKRDGLLWKPLPATDVNVRGTTRLLVLPNHDGLRQEVLEELHDAPYSGHLGVTKTTKAVQRLYRWPGVNADVLQFVKSCEACQRNKISTQPPAGLLHPMPIPGRRWESVSLDLVTCMLKTQRGNDTVVMFVARLSKMVHFHACTQQGTDAVAMAHIFIEQVYRLHGVPKEFVSDRDPRFTGEYWAEVCKLLGTKCALSSSYHPQTDGQTERANRVLEEMLRHYVNPSSMDDWDGVKLALAEFAVNNAWQESVQDTPFRLNYGQHPLTPASVDVDVRVPAGKEFIDGIAQAERRAKTLLQAAQQTQKAYADQGRREASFDVGDEVLLNTKNLRLVNPGSRKLLLKSIGPLTIVSKVSEVAYKV
eukprot:jgi/Chrzof1/8239/Cz03g02190.t1